MEVEDGGAKRPEEDLHLAVLRLAGAARDDVIRTQIPHLHSHGMGLGERGVHEHANLADPVATPEAQDVIVRRKGFEVTVRERGKRTPQGDGVAVDGEAVLVDGAPGKGSATVGVREALKTRLVPVVDARNTRHAHLKERRDPEPAHGKTVLSVAQAIAIALLIVQVPCPGGVSQYGEQADPVMAAKEVELAHEVLARVVLVE